MDNKLDDNSGVDMSVDKTYSREAVADKIREFFLDVDSDWLWMEDDVEIWIEKHL